MSNDPFYTDINSEIHNSSPTPVTPVISAPELNPLITTITEGAGLIGLNTSESYLIGKEYFTKKSDFDK